MCIFTAKGLSQNWAVSADFEPHDPAGGVHFQRAGALQHGVAAQARDGDEDLVLDDGGRAGAGNVFEIATAAEPLGKAESDVGQLSGLRY